MPQFSLIIPLYNEQLNAPILLGELSRLLADTTHAPFEIILVDDGSTDDTPKMFNEFVQQHPAHVRLLRHETNRGKGAAVRTGMLAASGDWRVFLDADLAVPLSALRELPISEAANVIIGSRAVSGAVIEQPQGWLRRLLGTGYTLLARLVTGVPVSDFTCGFKCFSAATAEKIFALSKINRWSYDAEILYLAKRQGYTIAEIPVHWHNGPRTNVRLLRDIFQSCFDLIRIPFIHGRG